MKQLRNLLTASGAALAFAVCSPSAWAQETVPADTAIKAELQQAVLDTTPHIDYALVHERMAKLQKEIPLVHNPITHDFVEFFAFRKPAFTKTMLERANLYFPIFEKYLAQYNLPDELKYLSLIESGLDPRIISYAGAGGLWQFMPRTARLDFGLRVDKYVDERFDPYKSTEAACKYLSQLYRIFGDWEMALASYNTGPGNLSRAVRRSGGKRTFWEVYNHLHKQTRGYVPQYAAMTYMMHYAADHGITAENPELAMAFDTVHVNSYLNLETLAAAGQIPYDQLRKLNPHILTNVLPAGTRQFAIRVPKDHYAYLAANRQMILDSASRLPGQSVPTVMLAKADSSSEEREVAQEVAEVVAVADPEEVVINRKPKRFYHTVRRGETLSRIAARLHVSTYDLRVWNHLNRRGTIRAGQRLVAFREVSGQEAQQLVKAGKVAKSPEKPAYARTKYHTVQRGDTLWSISQRYGGVTVEQLKRLNGIRGNAVKPGMKLKIG
jgi:membrane-bound lytic murein transglycosylase D